MANEKDKDTLAPPAGSPDVYAAPTLQYEELPPEVMTLIETARAAELEHEASPAPIAPPAPLAAPPAPIAPPAPPAPIAATPAPTEAPADREDAHSYRHIAPREPRPPVPRPSVPRPTPRPLQQPRAETRDPRREEGEPGDDVAAPKPRDLKP
jgi:hypothetical protein